MLKLRDLKRSLALTLSTVLVFSGVDFTVFADESITKPKITSILDVGVSFFDRCNAYTNNNYRHSDSDCKYKLQHFKDGYSQSDESYYDKGHFGAVFTDSLTVPMDFKGIDNPSSFSKSNIKSVVIKDKTDDSEVEYYNSDSSDSTKKEFFKTFISLGYYYLGDFDDTFCELFDSYIQGNKVDVSDRSAIKDALKQFIGHKFEIYFNYNISSQDISIESDLLLADYLNSYRDSYETSITKISDIVSSSGGFSDESVASRDASAVTSSTGGTSVLSVPSSKTVKDKDFWKSDDNSIFSVKDDDKQYNTYYVDTQSGKNLNIPLNDVSPGVDITKVTINNNKVYDNGISLLLNSSNKDLKQNKQYFKIGLYSAQSDNIADFLSKQFNSNYVRYKGVVQKFKDIDFDSIDLKDLSSNAEVLYASTNSGLLGSDKYDKDYESSEYPYYNPHNYSGYYYTNIYFNNHIKLNNLPDTVLDDSEFSAWYTDDSQHTSAHGYDSLPVYEFTSRKLGNKPDGYSETESSTGRKFFSKSYLSSLTKTNYKGFIKLPKTKELDKLLTDGYFEDYSDSDVVKNIQPIYRDSSKNYYGFFESKSLYSTRFLFDFAKDYYLFSVTDSNTDVRKFIVDTVNSVYNENFSSYDDIISSSKYGVPCYKFDISGALERDTYLSSVDSCKADGTRNCTIVEKNEEYNLYVPEECIDLFTIDDYFVMYLRDSFSDNLESAYCYELNNFSSAKTLRQLGIDKYDFYKSYAYFGTSFYDNSNYFSKLSDLNGKYIGSLQLILKSNCSNYSCDTYDNYLALVKNVVSELEKAGVDIDYALSSMPDITSGSMNFCDYVDSIEKVDTPTICKQTGSYPNYNYNFTTGCIGDTVNSVSSDTYKKTGSVIKNNVLSIDNSLFNDKSNLATKGVVYPIIFQFNSHTSDATGFLNANVVNYAKIDKGKAESITTSLKDNSDVFSLDKSHDSSCVYGDYKFGNIVFASKPDSVKDVKVKDGKIKWTKPSDEGLGVEDDGNSRTDDVVKLEKYIVEIRNKDTDDIVSTSDIDVATPEYTIPDDYNNSDYKVLIYAVNKLGKSDGASKDLDGEVEVTDTPSPSPTIGLTDTPSQPPVITDIPYNPPIVVPTPVPTQEPTIVPTAKPTAVPTKEPTVVPTQEPTAVPEHSFTIYDKYYNDDGTEEIKERSTVKIKEGEHYVFTALDNDKYMPRVDKYEGIASENKKIVFEYDEKEKRVSVQGYVSYDDGTPISNKMIELVGKDTKSGITDNTGFYRIDNLHTGDYKYTLYNDVTTGSGVLVKCDISITKTNGSVKVSYKDDKCNVKYTSDSGVLKLDTNVIKIKPTYSPEPTKEPTPVPTVEPTIIPTEESTAEPTSIPTPKPTPVLTAEPIKKPKVTPKTTKKPVQSTPEPTSKPIKHKVLVQTGLYDSKRLLLSGVLILSGMYLVIVVVRKRRKK